MTKPEQLALVRDNHRFYGWSEPRGVDRGDAGLIYCAERAIERAFHRTGAQAYLDYMETK